MIVRPDISPDVALKTCRQHDTDIQADIAFSKELLDSWLKHAEDIQEEIKRHLTNSWTPERLDYVLYAILQVGCAEIFSHPQTDIALILTEYLDIGHAFFQGDATKVINGVLHAIAAARSSAPQP